MDYFPTASLITGNSTGVVTNGNLTCTGSQDCGFPAPWTRTAQEAAAAALSADLANGLLSVAIGATHPTASPVIYFTPVSPLLTAGEDAGACVGPTLPTRRRLLAADAYNVTTPGTWSFTVAVDGGAPLSGASLTAGGAGVIAPLTLAGAPVRACAQHQLRCTTAAACARRCQAHSHACSHHPTRCLLFRHCCRATTVWKSR